MTYAEQGKDKLAAASINEAIGILEDLEDYNAIAEYLTYMSGIYEKQDDYTNAINYSLRGLDLGMNYGLKKQISESNFRLSKLYEQVGDLPSSY
jgi:hypothetical protein